MKHTISLIIIGLMISLAACNSGGGESGQTTEIPNFHKVLVKEVQQAHSYTYMNVEENGKIFWIAVSKMAAAPGETYYYTDGMEMKNFESKDLGKVFESLILVDNLTSTEHAASKKPGLSGDQPVKHAPEQKTISVDPVEGGVTIGELFANPQKFEGKTILVRGEVVKVNEAIMGKNWVHLQDGTRHGDSFDLTLTTSNKVAVGDVLTFNGTISLNKDFGAGYVYDVIMEDASIPEVL